MIITEDDKDVKTLIRIINKLKKRNINLDVVEDMIVLLDDNNIKSEDIANNCLDRAISYFGGCG